MNIFKLIELVVEALENHVQKNSSKQFNSDLIEAINALKKIKKYF
jgi:hypothetical protein